MAQQSIGSRRTLRVYVRAESDTGVIDPTADVVKFGFALIGTKPADVDLVTGAWGTFRGQTVAKVDVGPGSGSWVPPALGEYGVWLKITDLPEIPYEQVGVLTITL